MSQDYTISHNKYEKLLKENGVQIPEASERQNVASTLQNKIRKAMGTQAPQSEGLEEPNIQDNYNHQVVTDENINLAPTETAQTDDVLDAEEHATVSDAETSDNHDTIDVDDLIADTTAALATESNEEAAEALKDLIGSEISQDETDPITAYADPQSTGSNNAEDFENLINADSKSENEIHNDQVESGLTDQDIYGEDIAQQGTAEDSAEQLVAPDDVKVDLPDFDEVDKLLNDEFPQNGNAQINDEKIESLSVNEGVMNFKNTENHAPVEAEQSSQADEEHNQPDQSHNENIELTDAELRSEYDEFMGDENVPNTENVEEETLYAVQVTADQTPQNEEDEPVNAEETETSHSEDQGFDDDLMNLDDGDLDAYEFDDDIAETSNSENLSDATDTEEEVTAPINLDKKRKKRGLLKPLLYLTTAASLVGGALVVQTPAFKDLLNDIMPQQAATTAPVAPEVTESADADTEFNFPSDFTESDLENDTASIDQQSPVQTAPSTNENSIDEDLLALNNLSNLENETVNANIPVNTAPQIDTISSELDALKAEFETTLEANTKGFDDELESVNAKIADIEAMRSEMTVVAEQLRMLQEIAINSGELIDNKASESDLNKAQIVLLDLAKRVATLENTMSESRREVNQVLGTLNGNILALNEDLKRISTTFRARTEGVIDLNREYTGSALRNNSSVSVSDQEFGG